MFPGLGQSGSGSYDDGSTTTTTTEATVVPKKKDCVTPEGEVIPDGEVVKTEDPCEHCYCMSGDIICMIDPCMGSDSIDGETDNCVALPPKEGECCPKEYKCSKCKC